MSDKVRFYLEQSVAELDELGKNGIFNKPELSVIMKKRSDFEHKVNSRGPKAKDFLRYVEYEINVDRLRAKRSKRLLGSTNSGPLTRYAGQRRILFIFERATRKLGGDIGLWLQYLEYSKSVDAVNVVTKIFTKMLQLHPTKPKLWVLAAKYESEENASIVAARTIMQRGLRFNSESTYLWLEYMKLELIYVSKIITRRKLLGIEGEEADQTEHENESAGTGNISLDLDAKDLREAAKLDFPDVNMSLLGDVDTNPALKGDIVLAIFDSALAALSKYRPDSWEKFCLEALDLFSQFPEVDRLHLFDHVALYYKNHGKNAHLWIISPVYKLPHISEQLPDMVKLMMTRYKKEKSILSHDVQLKAQVREFINEQFLHNDHETSLDPNIKLVLMSFVKAL